MNKARRKMLREALVVLGNATSVVEYVCGQEQDAMDNIPENLQESDRFDEMENCVDDLNDALEKMGEANSLIEAAIGTGI